MIKYLVREYRKNIRSGGNQIKPTDELIKKLRMLKNKGYCLNKNKNDISNKCKSKTIKEIEQSIKEMGAIEFLKKLFEYLEYLKKKEECPRYPVFYYAREIGDFDSKIPWQYLINIGIKFLHEEIKCDTKKNPNEIFANILNKSLLLTLNLSDSFFLESISKTFKETTEDMKKRLLIDRTILLNQYNFIFFKELCLDIQENFEKKFSEKIKNNKNYICKENIQKFLEIIDSSSSVIELSSDTILKTMNNYFLKKISIDSDKINSKYFFLENIEEINRDNFPLVQLKNKKSYIFLNKHLSIYSFYLQLMGLLKEICESKSFDNILGEYVEKFIQKKIKEQQIELYSGNARNISGTEHECDGYIYIDNQSILFEIKKKGLSAKSLEGKIESIVFDLTLSLIQSQIQLITRKIEFYDSNYLIINGSEIDIRNNNLRLFSITLDNFNSLGEKFFVGNYINNIVKSDLTIKINRGWTKEIEIEYNDFIKKINIKNAMLDKLYTKYSLLIKKDYNRTLNLCGLEIGTIDVSVLFDIIAYLKTNNSNIEDLTEQITEILNSNRNFHWSGKTNFCNYWQTLKKK